MGWRWFTTKREFMPKVAFGCFLLGVTLIPAKFGRANAESLPGFSHDNFTVIYEKKNAVLDDDKIRILAQRRYDSLKKRAEARTYFHEHDYKPRATNLHYKFSDIQAI